MHPSVIAVLALLLGWMLFLAACRILAALLGLKVIETANACACGYSMAGIPFGTCPECGRPHQPTAVRSLTRPRRILSALLLAWTAGIILFSWGLFEALSAIFPPVETTRQSLTLNSTAGDIHFEWIIEDPLTSPHTDRVHISVRETRSLPSVKPISDTITAADFEPSPHSPDAPPHAEELLRSIVDGTPDIAPSDRAALTDDLRWIIQGTLKAAASTALAPTGTRTALYWGSGTLGLFHTSQRILAWPFVFAGTFTWAAITLRMVRKWESRVKA